jgi:hypothetical protein
MKHLYRLLTRSFLVALICAVQACAVIHFENGEVVPDPEPAFYNIFADEPENLDAGSGIRHQRAYHHSLYQLAELSNALETSQVCVGLEWNQVTTEITPFDVVISLLDNVLFYHASAMGMDLWSRWSMEYSCRTPR